MISNPLESPLATALLEVARQTGEGPEIVADAIGHFDQACTSLEEVRRAVSVTIEKINAARVRGVTLEVIAGSKEMKTLLENLEVVRNASSNLLAAAENTGSIEIVACTRVVVDGMNAAGAKLSLVLAREGYVN